MDGGGDSGDVLGGAIAVDVRLMDVLYAHAILLNQAKSGFESLLFSVNIFELVFCFCTLDALNLHHLVCLM